MKQAWAFILALALAACASDGDGIAPVNPFRPDQQNQRDLRLEASVLYKAARESLESSDYQAAMMRYNLLITRYPFTEYAIQAQIERTYALYRNFDFDQALTDAERFLREHPRHASADYAQYLKGLINFDREQNLTSFLGLDTTKQDVTYARKSFDDFAVLVQKYPNSRYAGDARQRMIYLRNQIAQHELNIVEYYVRRGAYVAAAKRAETIVAQYPGAPAQLEALRLQERCYRELGLDEQANDVLKLRLAQSPDEKPLEEKGWWRFW